MPEICRFLGIVIRMYHDDHWPPHFHASYGGEMASIAIDDLRIMAGHLPGRVIGLILEWALEHRDELFEDWELARRIEPLNKIEPLV